MKININTIYCQAYITPYIKITHSTFLNGDYEFIIGWLKWELVISF